jgi:predicted O-methyltransferase YrrM
MIAEIIEKYCFENSSSSQQAELLDEIERFTNLKVQMPQMLSGKYQGQFLSFISKLIKPNRVLEIGTYTGYSGICLASGLNHNGEMITIDINEELYDDVKGFFDKSEFGRKINYKIGNALDIVPTLEGTFDIIFLDADKKNYLNYLPLVISKMHKGSLLITDNVLWKGKVVQETKDSDTVAIDLFNKQLNSHPDLDVIIVPIRDGVSLSRKK